MIIVLVTAMFGYFYENRTARGGLSVCGVIALASILGCQPEQKEPSPGSLTDAVEGSNAITVTNERISTPPDEHPVSFTAEISPPQAMPGSRIMLTVRMQLAPGWHIFALADKYHGVGLAAPTEITLQLPPGVELVGNWDRPEPEEHFDTFGRNLIYQGDVRFRQELRIDDQQKVGPLDIHCVISYQACDEFSCRRPTPVDLKLAVQVIEDLR